MADYYELYAVTAKAVKSVDEFYRVGGPATSNNAHISDMREYCEKNGVPLDFISTHHYPPAPPPPPPAVNGGLANQTSSISTRKTPAESQKISFAEIISPWSVITFAI